MVIDSIDLNYNKSRLIFAPAINLYTKQIK